MTAELPLLVSLQAQALAAFQYAMDLLTYGELDYWASKDELLLQLGSIGVFKGDCDDFAAYVMHLCREAELPARYVLCQTEEGVQHLVVEVQGWIFDCRQANPVARDLLPYKWISISGYAPGEPWRAIG